MTSMKNKKLIQEIGVLIAIMVLVGGIIIYKTSTSAKKIPVVVAKPLETNFDDSALNQLQQKDNNYPDVTPTAADLGKTDPFSN